MEIGSNIKRLRKSHGETQQQLGEAVGVVQQSVAAWESNRCMPDVVSLVAIATHYNISTDFILGLSDEPNSLKSAGLRGTARRDGLCLNDRERIERLPPEIRDGVIALIRMERELSDQ